MPRWPERSLLDRFIEKVDKAGPNGCWLWTGAKAGMGPAHLYGVMFGGPGIGREKSHRVSYRLYRGEIGDGMEVCHQCDNPGCVNPEHLFLGSHRENMKDAGRKNRIGQTRGERHGTRKLTDAQVLSINERLNAGERSWKRLSEDFGVGEWTIRCLYRGESHRHLTGRGDQL